MSQQLQRADVIRNSLASIRNQVNSLMLKDKQKADRFLAASLVVATDWNLNQCSPDSIAQSLLGIAMLDLNVDKNVGHAYLVPYKGNASLQLGFKGYIQLMYRAGWMCKVFPVYLCDEFSMEFDGWDNKVKFVPNLDARDEGDKQWVIDNLRGIYVVSRHADSKDEYSAFVNKAVIEKLRKVSPNQKDEKPSGVWLDWYAEMAMAKAVKKLAKMLPIGDRRLQTVLAVEDKIENGKSVDLVKSLEQELVIEGETIEAAPTAPTLPKLSDEEFKAKQETWFKAVSSGKKTPQEIITTLSSKNSLTQEQIMTIDSWAHIEQ